MTHRDLNRERRRREARRRETAERLAADAARILADLAEARRTERGQA